MSAAAVNIQPAGEDAWTVGAEGQRMTIERDEAPDLGHTAGQRPHNWEMLVFGPKLRLRWSNTVTDSEIKYYCDHATEWTHVIEVSSDGGAGWASVELDVRNLSDPAQNAHTEDLAALQPWLDAVLGAAGAPPTLAAWKAACEQLNLRSFCPGF